MTTRPTMPAPLQSRRHDGDRGAATTEFTLAVPLLLVLLAAIVQGGLWMHAHTVARAVATDAVEAARIDGATATAGQRQAELTLDAVGRGALTDPRVTVDRNTISATVTVTGSDVSLIPLLRLPVRVAVSAPAERLTTPGR